MDFLIFFLFLLYVSTLDPAEQFVASLLVSLAMLGILCYVIYYRRVRTLPQDQAATQPPRSSGLLPVYHPRDQQGGYVPFDREESQSSANNDLELQTIPLTPHESPPNATTPRSIILTTTTHHIHDSDQDRGDV